jgi:hypothetical protein
MDCGRGRSSGWALIGETCSHRAAQFLLRHIIADSVNVRISAWRPKPNPLLAAVCMGLVTLSEFARLVPPKDPLDGVDDRGDYPLSGHLRFGGSSIIWNKQQMPRLTLFGTCLTRPIFQQ